MLHNWFILAVLSAGAFAAVSARKLTIGASIAGWVIGLLVYLGSGVLGVALMASFFLLATIATAIGLQTKQQLLLAEESKGRRTAGQVIANAGVAGMLGLLILFFEDKAAALTLMMAASLSSATADTLSSELGSVYGKKFYNILTLKKDVKGLDGVISLEGTLIGVAGSCFIAAIAAMLTGFYPAFIIIVAAGTVGNIADSVVGAAFERKHYINNNAVNFLNTAIAAIAALLLNALF